jgi:CubicO group peptidase (beta-lactamase class C family)
MAMRNPACFLRVAFSVAFSLVAFRATAASPLPQAQLELTAANLASVIDPLMAEWIDNRKGPGAAVVVVTRDGPVFAKGYGFADIEARRPFTADATLVRPGSISKLFTGIAVMQLVDAGKLDLDRDVNVYIDFSIPTPAGGVPVTLRRLLTHRAGFEEHAKGIFSRDREPEPLGRWLAENLPRRLFPNGDVEAYSNYGVALAGYVVERVSGEPYAAYVQRHTLDPLGMRHSTFFQPLPDDLAPLMAKGYRRSDAPPLAYFETFPAAPAGALSATATDMGRFLRALMNGGELDGVRILPKARLEEMMAPENSTPVGYLGLVFFGRKVAGHDAIGHEGATTTFFSDLKLFPDQGVGIFVSRDGLGEIKEIGDLGELPDPVEVVAARFLPRAAEAADARLDLANGDADVAGVYQTSRREESSFARIYFLLAQFVVKVDGAGHARSFLAIWPFGEGSVWKRVERNLYEGPSGARIALVDNAGSESYLVALPGLRLQRVPWSLDLRWIAPAFVASTAMVLVTLLAWPVAALWRHLRKRQSRAEGWDRRSYLAIRLVLLIDATVIVAAGVLLAKGSDPTNFNDTLNPLLILLYALAWLGVLGVVPILGAVTRFWRNGVGSRWSRVRHTLVAASSVTIAWFFLTFHIAGTTLNY